MAKKRTSRGGYPIVFVTVVTPETRMVSRIKLLSFCRSLRHSHGNGNYYPEILRRSSFSTCHKRLPRRNPRKTFRASAKIAVRNQAFDAGPFRRGFWSIKAEEVRPPVLLLFVRFHKFIFKLSLVFFKVKSMFAFTSCQRKFHCPCLT